MKTVVIVREGNSPVDDQLAQMRAWLAEHSITPRELFPAHISNSQMVLRATLDTDADAALFVEKFA